MRESSDYYLACCLGAVLGQEHKRACRQSAEFSLDRREGDRKFKGLRGLELGDITLEGSKSQGKGASAVGTGIPVEPLLTQYKAMRAMVDLQNAK